MDHRPDVPSGQGEKAEMRAEMRAVWRATDVRSAESAVTERVLSLPSVRSATTVATYAAMPGEIPADLLRDALTARGVRVLLPVLLDDDSLSWRAVTSDPLVAGPKGTRHPAGPDVALSEADVVVVPGLAFDRSGRRLGRGGGSYDRALCHARPDATVVGIAVDEGVVDAVPAEPHDRSVHVVVTPSRVLRTGPGGC
ncbi:MAG TPA: 5-formyltetrahydrofolate cyclo-ligase [Mycobacteriales bacterium]|nr:5-formyltetrahydrofolate cyclo-ligase [Mycobacteriales bacterium]